MDTGCQSLDEVGAAATLLQACFRRHQVNSKLSAEKQDLIQRIEALGLRLFEFAKSMEDNLLQRYLERRVIHSIYEMDAKQLHTVVNEIAALQQKALEAESLSLPEAVNHLNQAHIGLQVAKGSLGRLVIRAGAETLYQLMELRLGEEWSGKIQGDNERAIHFYNQVFKPIEVEEAILEQGDDESEWIVTCSNNDKLVYSNPELGQKRCFISESTVFPEVVRQDQVCGAELCIPYKDGKLDKLLIVKGHFAHTPVGVATKIGPLAKKRAAVLEKLVSGRIPRDFADKWLDQYGLRDWALRTVAYMKRDIEAAYAESCALDRRGFKRVSKAFCNAKFEQKRRMICLLTLGGDGKHGVQILLKLQEEERELYEELFRYLPHSVQEHFEALLQEQVKEIRDLEKKLNSQGSFAEQIRASAMPEAAKIDALEKAQMIDRSMTSEPKAEEYLRRLLRFPWGCQKELPVTLESAPSAISEFRQHTKDTINSAILGQERAKEVVHGVTGRWISTGQTSGVCLGFEGSPGVGKTEMAMAVAKAWDLPVVYISCGGLSDGSFLKGHGYTWEGSQPGRVVSGLMAQGYENALFIIDEVDKLSDSPKGQEVAEALLELTDPNRNDRWEDTYFQGIPFPLNASGVILVYNYKEQIPKALWSRITNVKFDDLSHSEKIEIARDFMLPKVAKRCGFEAGELTISNKAVEHLVRDFEKEAGVRKVEQRLLFVCTEVNNRRLDDMEGFKTPFKITESFARKALDKVWYKTEDSSSHSHMYT